MWVATAGSSANSMSLVRSLCTFDLSEMGEVEEPVISAGTKVDSFCCCVYLRHVLATGQRKSQSALEQGRNLV